MRSRGYWRQLYGVQNLIEGIVEQDITDQLAARGLGPRNQGTDNALFEELTGATAVAISQQDYGLPKRLFHRCYPIVRQFEQHHGCEVHKGAITFNVAIAFLRSNDFPAAMHYFELAQVETQQTIGDDGWSVFDSDLFTPNYWTVIDTFQQQTPLQQYEWFWGTPFSAAEARIDWNALSANSKLLYLIINAERISYKQRLRPEPHMAMSQSTGLAYWNLISDLVRLLETELSHRGFGQQGLLSKILQGINAPAVTAHAGFRTEVNDLHQNHTVNSPATFDAQFPRLQGRISDPALAMPLRIAAAAYIAGAIRNQVQHQVEATMVIFTDRVAAEFVVDTLLGLCRLASWVA